jgi:hypothetical protein
MAFHPIYMHEFSRIVVSGEKGIHHPHHNFLDPHKKPFLVKLLPGQADAARITSRL